MSQHLVSSYTDLADAISSIGSVEAELVIDENCVLNAASIVVPSTMSISFIRGNKISGTSGGSAETLTVNGEIKAGLFQIFGSTLIVAGAPKVPAIYPQWFGFSESASAADNSLAVQAALDWSDVGSELVITTGEYDINELDIPYKTTILRGTGWGSVLNYKGTTNFITLISDTHAGFVMKDLKIVGSATAGHGIYMDDGAATGNLGNVTLKNLFVKGFSNTGKSGFYGKQLYNVVIKKCVITYCYNGISLGEESMNCEIEQNFIRQWDEYGVSVVGVSGNECFKITVKDNIIDEPVSDTGIAAVYLYRCNTSVIEGNHFERAATAISMDRTRNVSVLSNQFSASLTNSIIIGSMSSNGFVSGNRYLSGAITDNGTRTVFFNDNPYTDIGDGGGSDTRLSLGASSTPGREGFLCLDAGKGIDLLGRQLINYSMLAPNAVFELATALTPHVTESDTIKVVANAAAVMDGFSSASSLEGRRVILYFADGNTTLRDGVSGSTSHYFRLKGGVNWNPAVNDSITFLCLDDGTWLEVGRTVLA